MDIEGAQRLSKEDVEIFQNSHGIGLCLHWWTTQREALQKEVIDPNKGLERNKRNIQRQPNPAFSIQPLIVCFGARSRPQRQKKDTPPASHLALWLRTDATRLAQAQHRLHSSSHSSVLAAKCDLPAPLSAPRRLTFRMPVYPSWLVHGDHTRLSPAWLTSVTSSWVILSPSLETVSLMVSCFGRALSVT
jgi:hypothetical protein